MGRARKYATAADKQRAYRERAANRNVTVPAESGRWSVTVFRSGADLEGVVVCSGLSETQSAELVQGLKKLRRWHQIHESQDLPWVPPF